MFNQHKKIHATSLLIFMKLVLCFTCYTVVQGDDGLEVTAKLDICAALFCSTVLPNFTYINKHMLYQQLNILCG